jgi:hypothetical protein
MEAPLSRFQEVMYEKTRKTWPTARTIMQLAVCVRLEGPIDIEILSRAATRLSARYPILSSRLYNNKGRLVQRQNGGTINLEIIDLPDDEEKASKILSAEADRPFDLFEGNPFKAVLGRISPESALLMLVAHHIFVDDFALQRLLAEYLNLVITPPRSGGPPSADDEDHGYLTWRLQQERMSGDGTYARRAEYWLKYLEDTDPEIHFPGRQADPEHQKLLSIPFELDAGAAAVSLARARKLGVTHNALLVSIIFHTLREATGQSDITLQLTSNARRPPFARTIGQFAEVSLTRQHSNDNHLDDKSIQLVFRHIVDGIKNYIPPTYFADQIDWLVLRREKKFMMTDVLVNYLPREADLDGIAARSVYSISRFELLDRLAPSQPPYYGVVMNFYLRPRNGIFSGAVEYESGIVSADLAREITISVRDDLANPPVG